MANRKTFGFKLVSTDADEIRLKSKVDELIKQHNMVQEHFSFQWHLAETVLGYRMRTLSRRCLELLEAFLTGKMEWSSVEPPTGAFEMLKEMIETCQTTSRRKARLRGKLQAAAGTLTPIVGLYKVVCQIYIAIPRIEMSSVNRTLQKTTQTCLKTMALLTHFAIAWYQEAKTSPEMRDEAYSYIASPRNFNFPPSETQLSQYCGDVDNLVPQRAATGCTPIKPKEEKNK